MKDPQGDTSIAHICKTAPVDTKSNRLTHTVLSSGGSECSEQQGSIAELFRQSDDESIRTTNNAVCASTHIVQHIVRLGRLLGACATASGVLNPASFAAVQCIPDSRRLDGPRKKEFFRGWATPEPWSRNAPTESFPKMCRRSYFRTFHVLYNLSLSCVFKAVL